LVILSPKLPDEVEEAIEAEKLPGVKFSESPARYYPNGIFASHLIGYTDTVEETVDNKTVTTLVGKTGLEGLYNEQLTGVRALFLYPLNALINSQQERLSAWTSHFGDKLRFCLYNGETEEFSDTVKHAQKLTPQQVLSRELLRENPSPILVTNGTMLEHMLIRQILLQKSNCNRLKYIYIYYNINIEIIINYQKGR